ncbi:UDP-2,3-diacylglucosamine pyrophosphatase LpxG [Paenibacillus solanacearum]|uniref:UDP-2,3-diacylglucosamine pyrophosphatase LpxG n=1 Tax=Paenibacillus solanacearum TaxID=2048548 RepID=A0A916K9I1_9BACL|nr:metallophosphoesterase [Paenibacillus solanacearum]CAG7649023.1 UDP-2,3-diacylglucosamine pyrophosphatase LpxG [Paenibacillus solanacearum]
MNYPPKTSPAKLTRRTFLKKTMLSAAAIAALPPAGFGYARYAEPRWLERTSVTLRLDRLPEPMDGLRIAQFSDVHLGFHYMAEDLLRLGAEINLLQPDILCFTGDLVDYAIGSEAETRGAIEALASMEAPLGKFAVLGNHDYYSSSADVVRTLTAGGFTVLRNDAVRAERNGGAVWIAGVEDQWQGKPDIRQALKKPNPDDCVVLLSHCPDYADVTAQYPVDVQLSGHSHGGQVRLPFYGHIVVPKYARNYVLGLYALGGGKLQLYVNRGIGVSQYPVRFWCRPELTLFTLRSP